MAQEGATQGQAAWRQAREWNPHKTVPSNQVPECRQECGPLTNCQKNAREDQLAAPGAVQCPGPNKAKWYRWESPINVEINTTESAQKLAYLHFTVCDTNPLVTEMRKKCKEQRQIRWRLNQRMEQARQVASQERQLKREKEQAEPCLLIT